MTANTKWTPEVLNGFELLQFDQTGLKNNWATWYPAALTVLSATYKRQATFLMKNNKKFVPPPTPDQTGRSGLSKEVLAGLDLDFHKSRAQLMRTIDADSEAFMLALINSLSKSSKRLIKTKPHYQEVWDAGDPNRMWTIIREAHLTKIGGAATGTKVSDKSKVKNDWAEFRMESDWTVDDFMEKYEAWLPILVSWGIPVPDDEEQGFEFIDRLDPLRFRLMQKNMRNASLLVSTYPKTLIDAHILANGWVEDPDDDPPPKNSSNRGGSEQPRAFVLCGAVKTKPKEQDFVKPPPRRNSRKREKGDVRDGDSELECFNCGKIGHVSVNCDQPKQPVKVGSNRAPRRPMRGPREQKKDEKKKDASTLMAVGEESCSESEDEDMLYSRAFSSRRSPRVIMARDIQYEEPEILSWSGLLLSFWSRAMMFLCRVSLHWFGSESRSAAEIAADRYETEERAIRRTLLADHGMIEIIWDTAASHSLFYSKDALSALTNLKRPYSMKGVERESQGIRVSKEGTFEDLGAVHYAVDAVANILSQAELKDRKFKISYDSESDEFRVLGGARQWVFGRKLLSNGSRSRFYTHDFDLEPRVLNAEADFTVREVKQADQAVELAARLGHMSDAGVIGNINSGILNCGVTQRDVRNAKIIRGPSVAGLKGRTKKRVSLPTNREVEPRIAQPEQVMSIDIMFVEELPFLVGVISPLGLTMSVFLRDRSGPSLAKRIKEFLATARSRNFDVVRIESDGEGGVVANKDELRAAGIVVDFAGPGQHVPVVERMIQTIKEHVRAHVNDLPYVMNRALLIGCVQFCTWCVNMQKSATSVENVSPHEKFSGEKLDFDIHLRCKYGQYCQATTRANDNSMAARTEGCITMGWAGNLRGSVLMWCIETGSVIVRDQFTLLPTPTHIVTLITESARRDGLTRAKNNPDSTTPASESVTSAGGAVSELSGVQVPQPTEPAVLEPEVGVSAELGQQQSESVTAPTAGVEEQTYKNMSDDYGKLRRSGRSTQGQTPKIYDDYSFLAPKRCFVRRSSGGRGRKGSRSFKDYCFYAPRSYEDYSFHVGAELQAESARSAIRQELIHRSQWHNQKFAFKMSVKAAMRDRPAEAKPVIMAELRQMVEKGVWHAIRVSSLSDKEYHAIIRSSMFLVDKYLASGKFEKFKARLVAGGDMQNKELYESLSSPTAATSSVLTVAAIAAAEWRFVMVIDIGGAFLNADMAPTGVLVHMRLDRIMTAMLLKIQPKYKDFIEESGCMVVALDKALYGCVEASSLWFKHLRNKLLADSFEENAYDCCVYNKFSEDGEQITVVLHVDDLLVTSVSEAALEAFDKYLQSVFPETKTKRGRVLDYIGMSFDFRVRGEVSITMKNCVDEILAGCGEIKARATPATVDLFTVRETTKATSTESVWFHSNVAKMLYLAKRVRPECLTAVSFLSTRVQECDQDDVAKLRRLLGYVLATRERGITLRIGESMTVKAYIDAAYGVHSSGRSHTGCAIVLGEGGPLFSKSAKQKIVTKSSTEAELVGLSDTASQAIHLRNFVVSQGYDVGPAVLYQDNMSCMALMKRGGPSSERSRHIDIRYFWLKERVGGGEVVIEHLGTADMFANVLTKAVQGSQFERERMGLTNWRE